MKSLALSSFKHARSAASFAGPSLLDQTLVSGLNFLVGIYLAYRLGLAEFGQFSLILIVTFFCLEIQRAIILAPFMTFAAKKTLAGYGHSVLLMTVVVTAVMAVLSAAFIKLSGAFFPLWGIASYALPSALLIVFRTMQEFCRRVLFIRGKPYAALRMDIAVTLMIVGGLFLLQRNHALDVYNTILLHGIAYAVGFAIGGIALRDGTPRPTNEVILHSIKRHWQYGRWMIAGVIATYASSNLLLMAGAAQLGSQAAGIIKTAQYLMGGMVVLFQATENIVPHRMAQLAEEPAELKRFFLRTLGGMMAFCVVHGFFIYLFVEPISHLVAPGREHDIYPIAVANIFFTAFLVVTYCLGYLLRALEKTQVFFWANATTALFSLLSANVLIGHYGVMGITVGLFIIQVIVQVFCITAVRPFWRGRA